PNGDGSTKTSWEGRHIWALKISDNVHVNESDEPDILYVGVHHAREWMTSEMMVWFFEHILADYGTNDTITN
ncbi:MAG: zinc carboxypeptidase, partial [Thermoplasmata archaeon]|nr:zinc carboxypeptidase [Thermoplasmata archaeon]NIS12438.1 zinc carboxypeptidase [Thermoplasmata archaeon]NIS20361.1 zinc carboxypeptidase [Thermoplasmata archaeon]NIT77710.1 zinc carboxypeptidase [Thermoplasmata archaeon]NIU49448.1 zinc carboxypeptidase [Thermoplasmata archaeon]